jgi:multimeric flavodoxin WrbA
MNIVALLGSPRPRGNSATLAARFLETAESLGARGRTFALNKLDYKGCQACYQCKTKLDRCALDDGLTPVLQAVAECDLLVVASPIYYGEVSSQTKAFIDRTFGYFKPDYMSNPEPSRLARGKKAVWILAQQSPDPGEFADVFPRYAQFFNWLGFKCSPLRALGVDQPGEVKAQAGLLAQTDGLARTLMGG